MAKAKGDSTTRIKASIEEICLMFIQNKKVLDALIPVTRIDFEMFDELKGKKQVTNIITTVDPIKIHVAFRHILFFGKATSKILANLPQLQQEAQKKPEAAAPENAPPPPSEVFYSIQPFIDR